MKQTESPPTPAPLRLDLYLKWSGLVRRRTLAKWLCERGAIRVNQQVAKAGRPVGVGDTISIIKGPRTLVVLVLAVPGKELSKKTSEAACYSVVSDETRPQRSEIEILK